MPNYNRLTKPELIVELLRRDKDVKEMGRQVADSKTVNYSENALEIANDKIDDLQRDIKFNKVVHVNMESLVEGYKKENKKLRKQLDKIEDDFSFLSIAFVKESVKRLTGKSLSVMEKMEKDSK